MNALIPLLVVAQVIPVLTLEQIAVKAIEFAYCIATDWMVIGVILLKKTQIPALTECRLL